MAAMTTDRASPSAPSALRTKSPTSRPRSPMSPTTMTSASLCRQSMPSSVLLPTPVPAKRPMRWPRPSGRSASMARTWVSIAWWIGWRAKGLGGAALSGPRSRQTGFGLSSSGLPKASSTRPRSASPTSAKPAPGRMRTRAPGDRPATEPSGAVSVRPLRKPMVSSATTRPSGRSASSCSPTATVTPSTSTSRPTTSATRPSGLTILAFFARAMYAPRSMGGAGTCAGLIALPRRRARSSAGPSAPRRSPWRRRCASAPRSSKARARGRSRR